MIILHNEKLLGILRSSYDRESLNKLFDFLTAQGTFTFRSLPTHLFPAAEINQQNQYTGYRYVWIRDNVHIAHAHFVVGRNDVAINVANSLMRYFIKHKRRLEDIIGNPDHANDVMKRPHVRFDGVTLEEVEEDWSHAQNDALGYFLWFYCKLICAKRISPDVESRRVLSLLVLYFQAIRYWQDDDSGHWEEERKIQASSIGAVTSGLDLLLLTFDVVPNLMESMVRENLVTKELIAELAHLGQSAMDDILPYESVSPPARERQYDAALLFLVFPLAVVNQEMSGRIVDDVVQHLQGNHGVRRYLGDSFWAPDYKSKLPPDKRTVNVSDDMIFRNSLIQEGKEAQWCIFDSTLSTIFGEAFCRTRENDYLEKQTYYLNRALGQLTGGDCIAGEFRCPELYYIEKGEYMPNDSTPLLWAQANLMVAFHQMKSSLDRNDLTSYR